MRFKIQIWNGKETNKTKGESYGQALDHVIKTGPRNSESEPIRGWHDPQAGNEMADCDGVFCCSRN